MLTKNNILIAALVVYLLSAFFNTGYYHYDEHFQLIEFADLKTGYNKPDDLAWEYQARIRPALQPGLAYIYLSAFRAVHITDPYLLMLILRSFSAILALVIITYFIKRTESLVQENLRITYRALAYFLWFLPFVNLRFSSENYSGLTFLIGVALLYSSNAYKWFLIGCLLGLSFLFRFQTAFLSIGYVLWLLVFYKIKFRSLLALLSGGLALLVIGIGIDHWFYGEWTLTFYNYYRANIIHDAASGFGTSPWYFYITNSIAIACEPIGVFIYACFIIQLLINKRGLVCWILVPFLLVHSLIPHKELRFLFPVLNLIPLMVVLSIQYLLNTRFIQKKAVTIILKVVLVVIITINFFALTVVAFSPADNYGRMNATQTIQKRYKDRKIILNVVRGNDPYHPIPVMQNFYRNDNVEIHYLDTALQIPGLKNDVNLVMLKRSHLKGCSLLIEANNLVKIDSGLPQWITDVYRFFGRQTNSYYLFEMKK